MQTPLSSHDLSPWFHRIALTIRRAKRLHVAVVYACSVAVATLAMAAPDSPPPPETILASLRGEHPRVMAEPGTFDALKRLVRGGGLPAELYAKIKKQADQVLSAPLPEHAIRDGLRLLPVSRRVLGHIMVLAIADRIEDDPRYADRAWKEMEAVAAFPDWNPVHFLDTAEMTHALALGYDWLYDRWSDQQRRVIREAIVSKGLRPGLKACDDGVWWVRSWSNWTPVCHGGLASGALAVADVEPDLAARVVHEAVCGVLPAMQAFAPDGGGREGATYWEYAARYNIVLLASLETALGTDFGLSAIEGFGQSGYYQMYMSGADRRAFNFGDCALTPVSAPQHFWLARKYDVPAFSWFRLNAIEQGKPSSNVLTVLDLLWYDDRGRDFDVKTLPLDRHFRVAECASMRSAWEGDAMVVGIQAGEARKLLGHRQLDLGSFVLEALGERWIIDLGTESETYYGYRHHNPRWKYLRVRAEGHNLPLFNPGEGPDQHLDAVAPFIAFESTPQEAMAVVDLTEAYQPHAERAIRTFVFEDRKRLVLSDEIVARQPAELWWFLHTEADVELDNEGRRAVLTQNGKQLTIRLEQPDGARLELMDCRPLPSSPNPEIQGDNTGRRKLALHFDGVESATIRVVFEPQGN